MRVINKFLNEYYPSHPMDTVIRNKYYPKGLTEKQIYDYYLSVKEKLLGPDGVKNVAFLLRLKQDKTVLIRNQKRKPIYLTSKNYEDIITGRTNVVYIVHPLETNYEIIDIDPGLNLNRKHSLLTLQILLHVLKPFKYEAISTSETGIHLIIYYNKEYNINLAAEINTPPMP